MRPLLAWFEQRGFTVMETTKPSDLVDLQSRVVLYQKKASRATVVSTLLHEAGHVLLYLNRRRAPTKAVAGMTWRRFWRSTRRSRDGDLRLLQEEIAAWDRGWALGQRLKLRVARRTYDQHRTRCLMTYVRWAAK